MALRVSLYFCHWNGIKILFNFFLKMFFNLENEKVDMMSMLNEALNR